MTTMCETEVSCAVCGEISQICEMVSTNTCGPSDLDGRPAEMKRSTIDYWVYRCPSCGYCAPDLSFAPQGTVDVIRADSYREALDKTDLPAKCNEFLCSAEICKASGDLGAAVWATIHAAWVCDDAENQAGAVRCRLQAESLGRAAEMKGLEWVNPATGAAALRCDLLRRAGAFPEAQAVIDSAFAASPELADPFFRRLLRFEQSLLTASDRSAHTVDEIPQNEDALREGKEGSRAPRAAFSRQQRQQFARLLRAERWIQRRARRSVDRGDALYCIYRRLRRGLIEALRAALFSVGDKAAGGYRWPDLLQRVAELLPATPKEQQALNIVAAMPFRPDEPAWRTGRDALTEYLAASRHHRTATSTVQGLAGKVAGAALGIRDGRWLRLASGKTCKLLRWNGIAALLGDVGALDVIDYFDVLAAIEKDALIWIDTASEIEPLEAQLISPIPERLKHLVDDKTKAEDEEKARRDELQRDPLRSGMVFLQETEIAGLHYHQAKSVTARLVRGMRLQLMREPDNAYDTEAVAVLMESGEKLGYVPRCCNAGIARRLDAGGALGAWLADIAWSRNDPSAKHPWRLNVEIRSSDPSDTPDSAKLGVTTEPTSTPTSTPTSQRAARSYWPAQFAFSGIDKARAALGRNAPGEMCGHVDAAYRWAEEAWLFQHDQTPETGRGWQAIAYQFRCATGDSGLASEGALLKQELAWRSRIAQSPKRDTALALCLLRIESLWRQNLAEVDIADARGGGGVSMSIGLPPPPPLRPPPDIPLARRYALLRRIEALRPLRQLLRVIQRVECGLSASTADLRGMTLFNRDRTLVQAIVRQLAHALRESLRSLLKPTEEGICWEPDEHYARLFPFLIPNAAKWHLVNEAAALLEPETQDLSAQRALQAQLCLMQPETHRVGRNRRRRPTDYDLFVTEQLLHSAHTLDMRDVVNGTCPAMPMDRHNRLLSRPLWRLFDAFCAELFGKRRVEMLRDYPALLADEAAPLDFAITAWCREAEVATDADKPTERAAGLLLLEALVCHPGRWPDDLGSRIPRAERLCPL